MGTSLVTPGTGDGVEYTGPERRKTDPKRTIGTSEGKAHTIVENRFKGPDNNPKKPEDLERERFTEGEPVRAAVDKIFASLDAEVVEEGLSDYKNQYDALPQEIRLRCTWAQLVDRLNRQGGFYKKLARAMRGGGVLVDIDKQGNPIFMNAGGTPIMMGKDYETVRLRLYGEDEGANKVHYGYEMPGSGEEISEIEKVTRRSFVSSPDKSSVSSWMNSGARPDEARIATYNYRGTENPPTSISYIDAKSKYPNVGVSPLLKAKEIGIAFFDQGLDRFDVNNLFLPRE